MLCTATPSRAHQLAHGRGRGWLPAVAASARRHGSMQHQHACSRRQPCARVCAAAAAGATSAPKGELRLQDATGRAYAIARADVEEYKQATLHELAQHKYDSNGNAAIDLNSPVLQGLVGPLATWGPAAKITADMYSQGFISAPTLAAEHASGTTAQELEERLQALLKYLTLPGPLAKWLPPVVTLQHVGVNDLRYLALARDTAQRMLGGVTYGAQCAVDTSGARSAAFLVTVPPPVDGTQVVDELSVFAIHGGPFDNGLSASPQPSRSLRASGAAASGDQSGAPRLPWPPSRPQAPAHSSGGGSAALQLADAALALSTDEWSSMMVGVRPVGQQTAKTSGPAAPALDGKPRLWRNFEAGVRRGELGLPVGAGHVNLGVPLQFALREALARIPVNGQAGCVQSQCVAVSCDSGNTVPLWVVAWCC